MDDTLTVAAVLILALVGIWGHLKLEEGGD